MTKAYSATWTFKSQPDEFSGAAPFRGEADFASFEEAKAFIEAIAGFIFEARVHTEELGTNKVRDDEFFGGWKVMRDDFTKPVFQL